MPESSPILGAAMALLFATLGVSGLVAPRSIQKLAQRTAANTPGRRWAPFVSFVDSPHYVPAMRALAVPCLGVAALLAWTSVVAFLGL